MVGIKTWHDRRITPAVPKRGAGQWSSPIEPGVYNTRREDRRGALEDVFVVGQDGQGLID